MWTRRVSLAVATGLVLAASGCASQDGGDGGDSGSGDNGDGAQGGTIRVAETNTFFSFNTGETNANMDINGKIAYATRADWQYINPDLELVRDESFGTFEQTSEDPLTVEYNINDDVVWSDGNAIDKADMLLQWVVGSGYLDGGKVTYFNFAGDTAGLALTDMPKFSDENSMTLTYSEPYVDWEIAFGMGGSTPAMPAHVVAEGAGMSEEELVKALESAKPGKKDPQLQKIADFWNKGFNAKSLPDNEGIYLSSGPMIVSDMVENQSMTLVPNEKYTGDLKPTVDEITVRFIGDAAAQIAALRNGEVDVIAPQPTTETVEQAKAVDGAEVQEGAQLSYDHLDLSFDSDVFKDEDVRKAFLMTVPRQEILDKLIKPMYADAEVLNSQIYLPSEGDAYTNAIEMNNSSEYGEPDIEGAKELLNGQTPTVRILYNSENPIRVDAFSMIQNSAEQAGFKVEDLGDPDWGAKLGGGTYDASIFGWISTGVGSAGIPQLFASNGGGNYSKYSSDTVDGLTEDLLTETDEDAVTEIKNDIDAELFADGFGLPLFQSPGLIASADVVNNIEYMGNQTGVWWNFWEWSVDQ